MNNAFMRGVVIPLMTPLLENGDVDVPVLRELVDFEVEAGSHGLFVLGSFGQGPALEREQRMEATEAIIDQNRGRLPVIVHVGCSDTPTTIKLARHAEKAGADAIAVIPPFYYEHAKYEWINHFREVAQETSLPLVLYNNKAYCNIDVTPALAKELHEEVPQVVAQKLAFAPLDALLQHVKILPEGFATFAGTSTLMLPGVPYGVRGAISPQGGLMPEVMVRLWDAIMAKDWASAVEIQGTVIDIVLPITRLYKIYGRGVDRDIMRMRGFDVKRFPRWPTKPLEPSVKEELYRNLLKAGVPVTQGNVS